MTNENKPTCVEMSDDELFHQFKLMLQDAEKFDGMKFVGVIVLTAEDVDGNPVEPDEEGHAPCRTRILHNGGTFHEGLNDIINIVSNIIDTTEEATPQKLYTVQ